MVRNSYNEVKIMNFNINYNVLSIKKHSQIKVACSLISLKSCNQNWFGCPIIKIR